MMNILTSVRNIPSINATFETGLGESLWVLMQGMLMSALLLVQILTLANILYALFLIVMSWKKPEREYELQAPQKKFLIFIPAHNEEVVIGQIINNLLHEVNYPKELLDVHVIADNCTDNTAAISRRLGAKVIEHFSAPDEPKGKPYGIKYAFDEIGDDLKNYDAIAVFDADNLISLEFFNEVNSQMLSDPNIMIVQGYLDAKNVDNSYVSLGYSLSYYTSNRFFCYARHKLNIASVIGGTGFVMNRKVIEDLGWTVNSLTEDLELQMQCALHDYLVVWNHFAPVYDEKPTGFKQSMIQRTRWARGHWTVHRRVFAPLLKKVFRRYMTEGVIDKTALDCAFYCISPLATASSLVAFFLFLAMSATWQVALHLLLFLGQSAFALALSQYGIRNDSRQRSYSSLWKKYFSLMWYTTSGMFVYLYGILTYKNTEWVRTEHNKSTAIKDILVPSED